MPCISFPQKDKKMVEIFKNKALFANKKEDNQGRTRKTVIMTNQSEQYWTFHFKMEFITNLSCFTKVAKSLLYGGFIPAPLSISRW